MPLTSPVTVAPGGTTDPAVASVEPSLSRRVVSGTAQLTISNGVVRFLSMFTMPILTRLLSPQAYGTAALAGTVVSLGSVIALAGIDVSYARSFYSPHTAAASVVEQFCWRFALLSALVISLLAGAVWLGVYWGAPGQRFYAPLVALGVLLAVLNTVSQMRSRLRAKYRSIALSLATSGILAAMASIAMAKWWRSDAMALIVGSLLTYGIPVLALGAPPLVELLRKSTLSWRQAYEIVTVGIAAVVTAPMYWVMASADRWFIEFFHGSAAVGVYSIAYSVATAGMMLNAAISSVWLPEVVREYERDRTGAQVTLGRLMTRLIALLSLVWLATTAAGGDLIRWLAPPRFASAADAVPMIGAGVLFYGIAQLAMSGVILMRKFSYAAICWACGGAFSLLLNAVLVRFYGNIGAAFAQAISFAAAGVAMFCVSQTVVRLQLQWMRLTAVTIVVFVSAAVMYRPWYPAASISLLAKIIPGCLVAALSCWIVAPDWLLQASRLCAKPFGFARKG